MSTEPDTRAIAQATPRIILMGVLVVSVAHLITLLPGLWLGISASGQTLWPTLGFEAVALGAGVVGVFAGLGRLRDGFAIGLLCAAGAVVVSAAFGLHYAAGPTIRSAMQSGEANESALRVLKAVVMARVGIGLALGSLAGLGVLTSRRTSWRSFGIGLVLLLPVLAIAVWLFRYNGFGRVVGEVDDGLGIARLIASLLGGLVLFVIASVGGHYVIKAFDPAAENPINNSSKPSA